MEKKIAIEVAARIWCDQEYSRYIMNPDLAYKIARMLKKEADKQERTWSALNKKYMVGQ
jgi:hypothetical protein